MYQKKLGKSVSTERWQDPLELKNLASDPAYSKTVAEMRELLKLIP